MRHIPINGKLPKSLKKRQVASARSAIMSMRDLARLGDGKVAYIRKMTAEEATQMYPAVEGIPHGINVYALHAADGTPLALTDSRQAALGHAMGDELEVAPVH